MSAIQTFAGAVAGNKSRTKNQIRKARRTSGALADNASVQGQLLIAKTLTQGALSTAREEIGIERDYVASADSSAGKLLRAGQSGGQLVGVMLTITIAAAVGFIGTKVTSEIDDSIDTTAGSNYDNASNSISSGFADAMGLSDIVFLVLMFSVIMGVLLAFRQRR